MKKAGALLLAAALVMGVAAIAPQSADAAGINQRQHHQYHRINKGVRNGSLTRNEAKKLYLAQRQLNRKEQQLRRNGLIWAERLRLQQAQNRLSQRIYNQRHDRQYW